MLKIGWMLKSTVVAYFGGQRAVAEALGISISAVSQWGELVPPLRAARLQELTGGTLKFNLAEYDGWYSKRTPASESSAA